MIGFVGDVERHAAELRSRVKHPEVLDFFEARFSEQELESALDAAADDGFERTIEEDGFLVDSGYIDIEANTAVVTIWAPDGQAAAAKVRSLYGPAIRVDIAGPNPREPRPHEIDSYELVDDSTLRVHFRDWGRSEVGSLTAREADEVVTLDLVVDVWLGATRAIHAEHTADVELSAPLGSRVVIDGSTGERIPARDANWHAERNRRGR